MGGRRPGHAGGDHRPACRGGVTARVSVGFALLAAAQLSPSAVHAQAATAAEVVAVERAFAARVLEAGVKAGFTEYLAPDGVVFRPGPVNGRDFMADRPPSSGVLIWRPALAAISAAGDLGFSTGPYQARASADRPVAGTGWYLSVWWRQPDGTLRLLADHGLAAAAADASGREVPDTSVRLLPAGAPGRGPAPALASLDTASAPVPAHGEVRTMAAGALHTGPAARATLFANPLPRLVPLGGGAASSADLAYTYGSYTWGQEHGYYLRVWRLEGNRWVVVADVFSPTR